MMSRLLPVLAVALVAGFMVFSSSKGTPGFPPIQMASPKVASVPPPALADDCYFVYLDLGTNTAVQIHKLFQRHLFPKGMVNPYFYHYFGNGTGVCAFGWEPNPRYRAYLAAVAQHYNNLGERVTILSKGAGIDDGWATFVSDGDLEHREWAAMIKMLPPGSNGSATEESIPVMDVPTWALQNVVNRRIPANKPGSAGNRPPTIVMKLDIEGMDELVIAKMYRLGVLCQVNFVYTESHIRKDVLSFLQKALRKEGCHTELLVLDDETYLNYLLQGMDLESS
jgi:hypothetical protein